MDKLPPLHYSIAGETTAGKVEVEAQVVVAQACTKHPQGMHYAKQDLPHIQNYNTWKYACINPALEHLILEFPPFPTSRRADWLLLPALIGLQFDHSINRPMSLKPIHAIPYFLHIPLPL